MITKQELQKALPPTVNLNVSQDLVDQLNAITADEIVLENLRDNFVSYTNVMMDGKYRKEDYVNAIAYCTFKLMGLKNKDAYAHAFPQRYTNLIAKGATQKEISAYVAAYHKGKLVQAIMEQALVPVWLVNQDVYQKAINVQASLMMTAQSELVRTQAANSILTHLAKPKESVPLINIDMRPTSGMSELQDLLASLAEKQVNLIDQGVTAKEIAAQKLGGKS
ncbi:MAG: hypothetical protein ACK5LG_21900 [Bacteroides thetaiotaomicron]